MASNAPVLKTDGFETRLDSFYRNVEQMESLAEQETLNAIEELIDMGTIRDYPRLVRLVIGKMKEHMQERINKVNEARESVNR